jgi:hypothetical protein
LILDINVLTGETANAIRLVRQLLGPGLLDNGWISAQLLFLHFGLGFLELGFRGSFGSLGSLGIDVVQDDHTYNDDYREH